VRLTAEILERAASTVDMAWAQGDGSGSFCPIGVNCAYTALFSEGALHDGARRGAIAALVNALGGDDARSIWEWNDAPGRTKEEVSAMLRAVAASLRAAAHDEGTPVSESTDGDLSTEDAGQVEEACI